MLFDHVNQTGMHTPVKGMPTNKKQCKSGQNGMQHETEESTTRRGIAANNKQWETIYPLVKPVQSESGNVLCEVCLSHFSISHGGETTQRMRDSQKKLLLDLVHIA